MTEPFRLSLACNDYDRVRAMRDGMVRAEGIDLAIETLKPRQLFPLMLETQKFDVSEISLGSYVALVARGESPFVAIPVALSKIFRHSCIYVREGAGIASPLDLKGKRVGTTQYGASASLYMKGMLADEYGVRPEEMNWFIGGLNAPTEKPIIPLHLPKGVKLEFLPAGKTLEGMLEAGELDALFSIYIPRLFLNGAPCIRRLFTNFREVERAYYRKTGIFPVMHTVVIRGDVHRAHPWAAKSLYRAFCQARDHALEALYDTDALIASLPWLIEHVEESRRDFGKDFWSYGVAPNRPAFEAIARYVYEQGLGPRVVTPEELFAGVE